MDFSRSDVPQLVSLAIQMWMFALNALNALNHNSICTLVLTKCNGCITIKVISTLHLGEER